MTTRTLTRIRFGLNGLFLAAFLVRSLIPAGYMLDMMPGKAFATLTICTGTGPMTMTMPVDVTDTKKPGTEKHASHNHDAPCPFSVNSVFGFDGFAIPSLPLLLAVLLTLTALTAYVLTPQRRYGNASSRSPPVFSSR
jgi:hypothetical protein